MITNGVSRRSARSYRKKAADLQGDFQESQASYRAAKRSSRYQSKRVGIPSMGADANWHYANDSDYLWMSEVARDIDRNDVICGQILDRVIDNEVQDGFRPNAQTGDEKLDRDLEQRWAEESEDPNLCDVTGQRNFHEQERLVAREEKLVGDVFCLPLDNAVQIIENYRCRKPYRTNKNIVNGIELDEMRRPIRYWFSKDAVDPTQQVKLSQLSPKEAYELDELTGMQMPQVWHPFRQKRPTQTRGITAFAPLFDTIGIHDDIQYSKLVQQQITSFFAFIRERDLNFMAMEEDTVEGLSSSNDVYGNPQEDLTPGMELKGLPGEHIRMDSANIPNPEWFQHVKLLLTFVGINLGAPLVMVLMDAGETNFSGYRGAIDQARLSFRCNQRNRIGKFYRPYYNWRVRRWLDDDATLRRRFESTRKRVNVFKHSWKPPRWPYIEPTKDAMADLIRESNTLTSPRRRAAERGDEYAEIVREAIEDRAAGIALAIAAADQLNQQFGIEDVTWQHLYQPPMPQGVTLSLNAAGETNEEPQQQPPASER